MWLKADLSRDRLSFRENEGPATFRIRGRARLVAIACNINSSALRWGENSIPLFRLYATPLTVGPPVRYFAWFSCRMYYIYVVSLNECFSSFFSNVNRKSIARKNWTHRKKTFSFILKQTFYFLCYFCIYYYANTTQNGFSSTHYFNWSLIKNKHRRYVCHSLFLRLICV